jgi:iron complex outermembrane receptor protein
VLYYGHVDLDGPLADGKLAYRFNLFAQDGDSVLHGQKLKRQLASVALDWKPVDNLLVQFNASHRVIELTGQQGGFWVEDDTLCAFRDLNYYPNPVLSSESDADMPSLS